MHIVCKKVSRYFKVIGQYLRKIGKGICCQLFQFISMDFAAAQHEISLD